jgi:hypothetical protein
LRRRVRVHLPREEASGHAEPIRAVAAEDVTLAIHHHLHAPHLWLADVTPEVLALEVVLNRWAAQRGVRRRAAGRRGRGGLRLHEALGRRLCTVRGRWLLVLLHPVRRRRRLVLVLVLVMLLQVRRWRRTGGVGAAHHHRRLLRVVRHQVWRTLRWLRLRLRPCRWDAARRARAAPHTVAGVTHSAGVTYARRALIWQ